MAATRAMRFFGGAAMVGIAGLAAWHLLSRSRDSSASARSTAASTTPGQLAASASDAAPRALDGAASSDASTELSLAAQEVPRRALEAWIGGVVQSQSAAPIVGAVLTWTALDRELLD